MAEMFVDLASEILDQSFETKLIFAVKLYKSLYCADDPNHLNVSKNKESWLKVASICNKTVTECMSRWHSLMREYFLSPPNSTWTHIEVFRNLGPNLSNNIVQNPTKTQKDELLNELLLHSSILLSPELTTKSRLNVWMEIMARCNKIQGAIMPITKWQEYWFNLKKNLALTWSKHRFRLYKDGDDEVKIINVCGASQEDTLAMIASALMSNIELGDDWQNPAAKCKNCLVLQNALLFNGYCLKCRHMQMQAALCCKCNIEIAVHKYNVYDWSQEAISLLQFEVTTSQILLCSSCAKQINKKATINWKSCRICGKPQTRYDYFYNRCNQYLRDVLKDATNFLFSECEGLPGYICEACKTQIKEFNIFYRQFKETQTRLKYLHDIHFINDQFKKEPDRILQSDIGANNPPVTEPLPTPVIVQQNSPTVTRPFKCTLIRKPEMNLETGEVVKKKPNIPESINYDFSLQPSIQHQRINSSLSDNTFAIPQLAKVDQVVSKKNVNTKKRILDTRTTSEAFLSINSILNKNAITLDKGPSVFSLQPSIQRQRSNPSLSDNTVALPQLAKVDQLVSKQNVNTNKTILDTQTTSEASLSINSILNKNAITLAKGPIVFQPEIHQISTNTDKTFKNLNIVPQAVPKNHKANEKFRIQPKTVNPQELIKLPTSSGTKTTNSASSSKPFCTSSDYETIEDAPPVFCIPKNNNNTSSIYKNPSRGEIQLMNFNPHLESTEKLEAYPKSLIKINPQNDTAVDKIPHPFIPGAYLHGLTIRRVDTMQKSQATTIIDLKKIPKTSKETLAMTRKKIKKKSEKEMVTSPKQVKTTLRRILPKPQAKVPITIEQAKMILHQQQEIKKARKHWDNVNEYQVGQLPTETLPPPQSMSIIQQPNDIQCFHSTEQIKSQSPSKVLIKKEIPDNNDDLFMEKTLVSTSNPTIIYPDLFKLKSEPAEADDNSLTFTDIKEEHNSLVDGNSFDIKTILALLKEESIDQSKIKTEKEGVKAVEEERKEDGSENKKRKIPPFVKLTKLHIKLKRNKKIQALLSQQLKNYAPHILH